MPRQRKACESLSLRTLVQHKMAGGAFSLFPASQGRSPSSSDKVDKGAVSSDSMILVPAGTGSYAGPGPRRKWLHLTVPKPERAAWLQMQSVVASLPPRFSPSTMRPWPRRRPYACVRASELDAVVSCSILFFCLPITLGRRGCLLEVEAAKRLLPRSTCVLENTSARTLRTKSIGQHPSELKIRSCARAVSEKPKLGQWYVLYVSAVQPAKGWLNRF